MDVRYKLRDAPRILIMNNGGDAAGIANPIFDISDVPYEVIDGFDDAWDVIDCYSFVFQPHVQLINDSMVVDRIKNYLLNGGNLLLQCAAIQTVENDISAQLLVSNGVTWRTEGRPTEYFNRDMPVMQFLGPISPRLTGNVAAYKLAPGSQWQSFWYPMISSHLDSMFILSGGDYNREALGGNVFFGGGHSWIYSTATSSEDAINNPRMALNMAFIPAGRVYACAGVDHCICPGEFVQLGCEDLNTEGSFNWSPSDGLSCDDCPFPMASPTNTTIYTMTSMNACTSFRSEVQVTVNHPPSVSVDFICSADNNSYRFRLIAKNAPNGYAVVSNIGGSFDNSGIVYTSDPIENGGTYSYQIISDEGCEAEVIEGCHFCSPLDAIEQDTILCDGETLLLNASTAGAISYTWQDGSIDSTFLVERTGEYFVDVQFSECDVRSRIFLIDYIQSEIPLSFPTDTIVCEDWLDLDVFLGDDLTYLWSTGETESQIRLTENGIYSVEIYNDCVSVSDEIEVYFFEKEEEPYRMPNTFTPDGNGVNDDYGPIFNSLPLNMQFEIYNRWGQNVFSTNSVTDRWDGTYGGKKQSQDLYLWTLYLELRACGNEVENIRIHGDVQLLR